MKIHYLFSKHPWIKRLLLVEIIRGDGKVKTSVSLVPKIFGVEKDTEHTAVSILGVRVSVRKAGGWRWSTL